MKGVTGTYSFFVVAQQPEGRPDNLEGYASAEHKGLENYVGDICDRITSTYGNITDAHYIVEDAKYEGSESLDCVVNIVVTGIVEGSSHAYEVISDKWPTGLTESARVIWDANEYKRVFGFDANNFTDGPIFESRANW